MSVSEVGRTASGSGNVSPPPTVTTASSGAKPSTCSRSRSRNDMGMNIGNAAFRCPVALKRRSSACWMFSQMAQP